jgi:hypothetical protein
MPKGVENPRPVIVPFAQRKISPELRLDPLYPTTTEPSAEIPVARLEVEPPARSPSGVMEPPSAFEAARSRGNQQERADEYIMVVVKGGNGGFTSPSGDRRPPDGAEISDSSEPSGSNR